MSERRGKRYTAEQREELLGLYRNSGLSAARFCKDRGLSYPTLRRWLGPSRSEAVGMVEVLSADASAAVFGAALPNGLRIDYASNASPSEVRRWIRELRSC